MDLLKDGYWSKADAFLLPLTGLRKNRKYELSSHLFWHEHTIDDYKLILSFTFDNYEDFLHYCQHEVFPILDKKGYLIENYDIHDRSIFVLDISEYALDIEMFLLGKYSKLSNETKVIIEDFHSWDGDKIPAHIYAALYPNRKMKQLDNKTPIEIVARDYNFDLDLLKEVGEIGGVYDETEETLLTEIDDICQDGSVEA
jgi:hypothetical protein